MMENRYHDQKRLEAARKKVRAIKAFFAHLRIFLTVTIILAVLYVVQVEPIIRIRETINEEVMHWIDLNILVNLGIWALILLIHGLVAFRIQFPFIRAWEEHQLRKLLEEEQD